MDDEADFFRLALDASPTGILIMDASGTIVFVNSELERLFGYERSELIGRPVEMLIPQQLRMSHVALRLEYVAGPTARFMGRGRNLFGLRKDGTQIPVEIGLNPLETKRGKFVLSSITDITDRKQDEREREALQLQLVQEERFKVIFEGSPIAMAILDDQLRYVQVNDAYTRILGYSSCELAGRTPAELTHPEDRAADLELVTSLMRGERRGYTRAKRYIRRDGSIVHVVLHAAVVRDPAGGTFYIGQVEDITARLRAEAEVRSLQSELAREAEIKGTILKHMPRGALFLVDRELRYLSAYGPSVPELLNTSAEALLGHSAEQLIPAPYKHEVLPHLRATLDGKEVVFEAVRGARTYEVRSAPIYSGQARPVAALIHLYDITERKAQEHALAAERERFRTVVTKAPIGIFEMDMNGNVLFMNEAWNALTGLSPEQARSPAARMAGIHPKDRESVLRAMASAREDGKEFKVDFHYRTPNGTSKRLSTLASPMRGPDGSAISLIGITVDVTAQLEAAEATQRSLREKETLLREIHHRVKNNLQVIVSLIGLAASRSSDQRVRVILDDLRSRIRAIALLHERLYGSPDLGAIDLVDYLHGLVADSALTAGATPERIRVHSQQERIVVGMDDAVPVGLLVNELVTNAIKHGVQGTEPTTVAVEVALERDVVRLTVADSGPGFPPGFSPLDCKTLGMLLLRNLTHQLRGELSFSSHPTCVTLTFPFHGARREN